MNGVTNPLDTTEVFRERRQMAVKNIHTSSGRQSSTEIPESSIKVAAYYLWENEGRRNGDDLRHWYWAIAELSSNGASSQPRRAAKETRVTNRKKISSGKPKGK
jgi:hypothetical protein